MEILCEKECPYNALLMLIYDIIQSAIIKLEKFNTFK